ncbi:MAG: aldehyde dehydrogenase family protein [Oscillospiraceae bacterium]|nr:aldehyde dehydrogenase family protein [Oscillospiraceae bacterium]
MEAKMLINGKFTGASDGAVRESTNPLNGKVLGTYPVATKKDVEAALDAAQIGKKAWAAASVNQRKATLLRAADIFEQHAEELAQLQCSEMAKPIQQCRGEAAEISRLFRSCAAGITHTHGEVFPNNDAADGLGDLAMTVNEPLGVVACIGPFNYPVGTLTFKTAPALAMGNAVIIKAPSDVSLTVLRYTEILNKAGFPDCVIQAVSGSGSTVGEWLIDTPKINAIGLTGSTAVGSHIMEVAGKHFHRVLLELGGNSATIITESANLEYAVKESMCRAVNNGQVCSTGKRFLIQNSVKDKYIEMLAARLSKLKLGDPMNPENDMGPMVSEKAAIGIEQQINLSISQGAKLICGGQRDGAFITPTILDCPKDADVARDMEIFGPVWTVIGFDTEDEAVEIANNSIYGLTGGVITDDMQHGITLAARLEAGTVVCNGACHWRRDTAPFGGYKSSGIGREGILDLLSEFSQRKTIVIKGL